MNRPAEQTHFPGMKPADEPDVEAVKDSIYAWLDCKTKQRRAAEDTKAAHIAMLALLTEHELEWHPYIDPVDNKKRKVFTESKPKAKTARMVTVTSGGKRGRKKRGGPSRDADAEIAGEKEDSKVESRRVPRKSVEKEIDPFGATRDKMAGGVLGELEATQGSGAPIPEVGAAAPRKAKRKKKPAKKGKSK